MKKFYVGVKGIIKEERGYLLLEAREGYIDIPGGRIDEGEDFADTLRRELSEELPGADLESIEQLQGVYRLPKDIDGDVSLMLVYFLVKVHLPKDIVLSEEHAGYLWVNHVSDLPKGLNPEISKILRSLL